jgi:hypothetical protein
VPESSNAPINHECPIPLLIGNDEWGIVRAGRLIAAPGAKDRGLDGRHSDCLRAFGALLDLELNSLVLFK